MSDLVTKSQQKRALGAIKTASFEVLEMEAAIPLSNKNK
jgi:hypothetical protein